MLRAIINGTKIGICVGCACVAFHFTQSFAAATLKALMSAVEKLEKEKSDETENGCNGDDANDGDGDDGIRVYSDSKKWFKHADDAELGGESN